MARSSQRAFRLLRDMPCLPAGVVFVRDETVHPWSLYLAWEKDGCQKIMKGTPWAGGAFRLPGAGGILTTPAFQEWFEEIENDGRYEYIPFKVKRRSLAELKNRLRLLLEEFEG